MFTFGLCVCVIYYRSLGFPPFRIEAPTMEPAVLPLNAEMTAFHTFFTVHGQEFSFNVHNVPPSSETGVTSLKNAKLEGDLELRRLLTGFEPLIQQRLNQSKDVGRFVLEMKDIMDHIVGAKSRALMPSTTFYRKVYYEIEVVGWEHLVCLGEDLSSIHFRVFDQGGREHIVEIQLSPKYPEVEPIVSVELPCAFPLHWWKEANLKDVLNQFNEIIKKFEDFWDVMEDIDMNVWVMEPIHPSRACSFRRIALGGHCSVSLTVNAFSPRSIPECRFFGSDLAIAPLRKRWNNNIWRWKGDRFLRENLEDILEITFPSPQDSIQEDISADCGICYAFRLPNGDGHGAERGSVPDRACDKPSCGRPFHSACLIEWLRSITTTCQSFDVLFGNCPYCSHPIAVKTTSL